MAEETATVAADQASEAIPAPAGDTQAAAPPAEQTAQAPDQPVASAEDQLLSEEELGKYQDPKEQVKALQKAFTQKTQKLAEKRKLADAYERDPIGFAKAVAKHHGLSLVEPQAAPPEARVLAQALAPVIGAEQADAIEKYMAQAIERTVQPLYAKAALSESQAVLENFKSKHPDFESVEPQMAQLGQEFFGGQIPASLDQNKVLDALYKLATYDRKSAAQTKAVVDRINNAVASAEPQTQGVAPNRVAPSAPAYKNASEGFEAAIAAAKRGEAWR